MWLVTTTGFFSVTAAPDGRVQVRARIRKDLVKLLARVNGKARIIRTRKRDYLYRVLISPKTWQQWAAVLARDVHRYNNFKSAVGATDLIREGTYHKVWDVLKDIEREEEMEED